MPNMSLSRVPSLRSQNFFEGITKALSLAVSEWLLMFMLFIDACFSYLLKKFAYYCELQSPCLLCSRLNHVLGKEKTRFYWDLICGNHKFEISTLVLCHLHNQLVDVHGMCENCLFSFATINKSNAETYRLLVGKMGIDHNPLLEDHNLGSSGSRICCCCNEQYISKGYARNFLHTTSIGSEAAEFDAPLSASVEHARDGLKNDRDEFPASVKPSHMEKNCVAPLSYVEYEKVKITSDTESELPISDDDSSSALIRETESPKGDLNVQYMTPENSLPLEQSIHSKSVPETSVLESEVQLEAIDHHALEELNWQQVEQKADISTTELISLDEVPPLPIIAETPAEVSVETYAPETVEMKKSVTVSGVISKGSEAITVPETSLDANFVATAKGSQMSNYLDLGDAYKLAIGSKGRQLSGKLLEQRSFKEVSEDLKLLLSQISATRGIELPLNDMSPRLSYNSDEIKLSDASTSTGMQFLQRRISLERNESGLSLDGSIVSEIDGESVVDRLKRQVENDRKLMGALYKELEEERSASAVATHQAMAMITRLQEEKAALHMEASQFLRMMEEQAEYDSEALQKANDLLIDKEKQIQDLEVELDLFKKGGDVRAMNSCSNFKQVTSSVSCESVSTENGRTDGTTMFASSKNVNSEMN